VRATGYNIAAGSSSGSNLTLLTDTSSTRLNTSLAGSAYDYAILDFRRTTAVASTLTITSILAQLWPTGVSPTLTGNHIPGEGNTGLKFVGGSMESQYRLVTADAARWEGLGFSLLEVEA
jgi:diacylglycerol kinase family enzyme